MPIQEKPNPKDKLKEITDKLDQDSVIDESKSVRQQIAELRSQMPKPTAKVKPKTKSNDREV